MFTEEALIDNDEAIQFYTGLPNFGTLLLLIQFLTSGLSAHKGSLTVFQEIMLVLIKLAHLIILWCASSVPASPPNRV